MEPALAITLRAVRVGAVRAQRVAPEPVKAGCIVWVLATELHERVARLARRGADWVVAINGSHGTNLLWLPTYCQGIVPLTKGRIAPPLRLVLEARPAGGQHDVLAHRCAS